MYDRFLIAPFSTGLQENLRPWLISDDAFARLNNAFLYRGVVKKRIGAVLMNEKVREGYRQLSSRLRIKIGTTNGAGTLAGNVPAGVYKVGQMFSVGDGTLGTDHGYEVLTVITAGAQPMITTGGSTTHTYNTGTGAYNIVAAEDPDGILLATMPVYFYPAEPVMGLITEERPEINRERLIAFDTRFAYKYTFLGGWDLLDATPTIWTGAIANPSDFFQGCNFRGTTANIDHLFVTNNVKTDFIKYLDQATDTFTDLHPAFLAAAGNTIDACLLLISFKSRLILLNTNETVGAAADKSFVNRCRYSHLGDPLAAEAFYENTGSKGGGFIDASTKQAIISAQMIRDRLIVFFERSTWELVYTGSKALPFLWKQLNGELGVESTFSTIPFDSNIIGFGSTGIHACNGMNVSRIDEKIPDKMKRIHNANNGYKRVYGIRDYDLEMCYWSYTDYEDDAIYPTKVLVFNNADKSWAVNDDSITCFGYYQSSANITWDDITWTWDEWTDPWGNAVEQQYYRNIIAGNQQGFTFLLREKPDNCASLQVSNIDITTDPEFAILTVYDSNLFVSDFIFIESVIGITGLNGNIYDIKKHDPTTHTISIAITDVAGTYKGAGTITRVSKIDILTKEFNFYTKDRASSHVPQVDLYLDRTFNGTFMMDTYVSSSTVSILNAGDASGSLIGTNIIDTTPYDTLETTQDRFWHSAYLQASGATVQLHLYLSNKQMLDVDIKKSGFGLNALCVYARKAQ